MAYGSYYLKFISNAFFSYWDVPAMIVQQRSHLSLGMPKQLTQYCRFKKSTLRCLLCVDMFISLCHGQAYANSWAKTNCVPDLSFSAILSLSFHILCWCCCCCCHLNVLKWPKKINRHKNIAENVGRFLSFTWFWCKCVCVTKWAIMNVCVAGMFVWV